MKISLTGTIAALGIIALAAAQVERPQNQSSPSAEPGVIRERPASRAGMTGYDAASLTNEELTQQSDRIVVARVVDTEIFWTADGRNLYTLVTVDVVESVKGDAITTLVVAIPGGIDANRKIPIAVTYPGGPQLGVGEQAVLFLNDGGDQVAGSYAIAGFSQGKFAIGPDATVEVGGESVSLAAFTQEIRGYLQ
jgi:hypothetical protein